MTPLTRDQIGLAKSVDLLSLVSDDTDLQHLTQREFAGPCPFCGGTDRFHLQSELGRWFCRQCTGEPTDAGWQDAIDYVQRRNGLSFREAVAHLNGGTLAVSAIVHAPLAGHHTPNAQAQAPKLAHCRLAGKRLAPGQVRPAQVEQR